MKKVIFKTKDGVEIYGLYTESENWIAPAVLLLHMMPAAKESWSQFQEELREAGFQSLAIDERGHGESVWKDGERIDYKNFTDTEQQEKILDVEAAMRFLSEQSVESGQTAIAGASIGANLALQYQAEHKEIKATVLLSAGIDYKGIKTELLAERVLPEQSVYLAGAKGDVRSSGASCADAAKALYSLLPSKNKKITVFEGKEHGTDMFAAYPELTDNTIEWLKEIYF